MAIAFIGGIHGVGKGTICKIIANDLGYTHITASEILKWEDINRDKNKKEVSDVLNTQDRLIDGLKSLLVPKTKYLLDGHYCLTKINGIIAQIPVEIFKQINPFSLNLIIDEVTEIQKRLKKRDGRVYNKIWLSKFQDAEIFHAKQVSIILGVRLNICKPTDILPIINALNPPNP